MILTFVKYYYSLSSLLCFICLHSTCHHLSCLVSLLLVFQQMWTKWGIDWFVQCLTPGKFSRHIYQTKEWVKLEWETWNGLEVSWGLSTIQEPIQVLSFNGNMVDKRQSLGSVLGGSCSWNPHINSAHTKSTSPREGITTVMDRLGLDSGYWIKKEKESPFSICN